MTETIYMPLLDEGTACWRPVPALRVATDTYVVLRPDGYDDDDEHWQFPPGSVVKTANRQTDQGDILAAVTIAPDIRQIA